MKSSAVSSRFAAVALSSLTLASSAFGGPSTELPTEFFTGLELSAGRFALVDKATGQVRIGTVTAANSASFTGPFRTYQPDVTALASGFDDGSNEQLAISSTTANRIVFAPVDGSPTTVFFPQQPGPGGVGLIRESAPAPDRIVFDSLYGPGGQSTLELTEDANLGTPIVQDVATGLATISSLQPHYLSSSGRREALAVLSGGGSNILVPLYDDAGDIRGTFSDPLPDDTVLATNIRNAANRLTAVGFVPGSPTLTLITIDTLPTPWQAITPFPTDGAPWPVGNVSAAVGLAGAPNGLLLTSHDGTMAAFAQVNAAGNAINIVQTFANSPGLQINGMVAVPGRGILRLEGPAGKGSTNFIYDAWDGAKWVTKDAGVLPSLLPAQTDFATILWFDAEPLVDPNANLLKLDVEPDWVNGTGALPSALTRETFVSSVAGLDNPSALGLSPPSGATHVTTNQLLDTCSLSVLRPNSALLDPPLNVVPASGSYDNPVLVEADSIDTLYDIFYREQRAGAPWQTYDFAFGVGYPSTWIFYAKHKVTGATGPLVTRTYDFDPSLYPSFDSDNDAVPDYIEQFAGLDPNGGSDSDGDLQSDMEEILDGNDPDDITDFEPAATRNPPYIGEGFLLIAEAFDTTTGEASPGETIEVRTMSSAVLDDGIVEVLTSPAGLAGQLGAPLTVNTPVSLRQFAVLNSPLYFGLGNVATPPRDGREVYRALQIPDLPLPAINPVLVGDDLAADAAAWLAAAQAAYAAYEPVTSITELRPLDTAVAVLYEATLYDALLALDSAIQTTLGVPQDIPADAGPPAIPFTPGYALFTLFGDRDKDAERSSLSEEMILALQGDGLSFNNLLALLEAEVGSATDLPTLVDAIYDWHVQHSDPDDAANYMPGLPLPLDVLRGLVRGSDLPFEENPDPPGPPNWDYRPAALQALVDGAKAELAAALALLPDAYRPLESWTIEVGPPTIPGQKYGYTNVANMNPVVILNEFGEFITLDQGLGLAQGAQFSVQGYTDVTGPAGHDAIEALAIAVESMPLPSNTDLDGDLLDDKWEAFFFGDTETVEGFDNHPDSGLSYLAYQLAGDDPREDSAAVPATNVVLPVPAICVLPSTDFGLDFSFPDEYFDLFEWSVVQSQSLQGYSDLPEAVFVSLGNNQYQVELGVSASNLTRNFFKIGFQLK